MRSFYYRPGKNAFAALFMGALAAFLGKIWWDNGSWLTLCIAAVTAAGAGKAAVDALSRDPALKFDADALWVRKPFGGLEQIAWRDVHHIGLKVFTLRYWGLIPIRRTEHVVVTSNGGAFGTRRFSVNARSVDLPPGGAGELVRILQRAHEDVVGISGVAMAGAGKNGWGAQPAFERDEPVDSGFDADAAIARYLASKQAAERGSVHAREQTSPALQRPVFGRRQA